VSDRFRILVISDPHAVNDDKDVRTTPSMNYANGSAPRGLLQMCIAAVTGHFDDGIDLVLVAGDMTNQAGSGALELIWEDLQWLANELDAPLIATSGNHDYDSRAQDDPLPYKSLLSLEPAFPFGDENVRNKYFAEHHAIYSTEKVLVVTANSAAHHGYAHEGSPEHLHGRYSDALPDLLERSLKKVGDLPPIRIFLTHHHMNQLPSIDVEERSSSIGQEDVLRTLIDHGNWLVVHGHKHRGWIQYASGGGDAPPLLSASSFSADFEGGTFAEKVRHQFHVIELPTTSGAPLEGVPGSHGIVTSWTHSRIGWSVANAEDDLPGVSGFGWKAGVSDVAARITEKLAVETVMTGTELIAFEPRLEYLTFDDQRRLVERLENQSPKVRTILDDYGRFQEVSIVPKAATH
jgi:hypothetical protein